MEITILDLDIADCSLDSLNIRSSQGGILVALGGLNAASRGKVNARQLGWPYVEMEAKFTAEFNGHMSLLLDLFTTDAGKLALHIRDLQVDIHLSDINMLDFRGLNSFSSMLMFVIEAAAGAFTEKRITKVVGIGRMSVGCLDPPGRGDQPINTPSWYSLVKTAYLVERETVAIH